MAEQSPPTETAARVHSAAVRPATGIRKKVLIIGVDGVRGDSVVPANTPNLDRLITDGAVSLEAQNSLGQRTSSGPGWSSMLTGVWADKHGAVDNSFSGTNYEQYPHFFSLIKQVQPELFTASIVNWAPIHTFILSDADFQLQGIADEQVAAQTAELLVTADPDVLFLHFDDVDGAGHGCCYSPMNRNYLGEIADVDRQIGIVLNAIRARSTYPDEDWLVIVSSDHGGRNTGHGGQSAEERTIPFIVSGASAARGTIVPAPFIIDVAPTAMAFLEIPSQCAWDLDGQPVGLIEPLLPEPLACPTCPKDLRCSVDQVAKTVTLTWEPGAVLDAVGYELLRSGVSIGSVDLTESTFADAPPSRATSGSATIDYELRVVGPDAAHCRSLMCQAVVILGDVLFAEDFDGVPLGPNVDEGLPGSRVWTKTPPDGWTIDDSGVPSVGIPSQGVTEWEGWSFADPAWWAATAGDQQRSAFTKARGVIAVADPDEWDDKGNPDNTLGLYNTFLRTPTIDLRGVNPNTVTIQFDSSWRPECCDDAGGTNNQTATVSVSYDDGPLIPVLRWESDRSRSNFKPDATDETVIVQLNNPAGATDMRLTFGMTDAGNDWWWAVDHLVITALRTAGDCDQDADADLADLLILQSCFTGPAGGPVDPGCLCADADHDDDVDLSDLVLFQARFTGVR